MAWRVRRSSTNYGSRGLRGRDRRTKLKRRLRIARERRGERRPAMLRTLKGAPVRTIHREIGRLSDPDEPCAQRRWQPGDEAELIAQHCAQRRDLRLEAQIAPLRAMLGDQFGFVASLPTPLSARLIRITQSTDFTVNSPNWHALQGAQHRWTAFAEALARDAEAALEFGSPVTAAKAA